MFPAFIVDEVMGTDSPEESVGFRPVLGKKDLFRYISAWGMTSRDNRREKD